MVGKVKDKVGNTPAITVAGTSSKKYKVTYDIGAPAIQASGTDTGYYLKNAGVLTGTSAETEADNQRTSVRAKFDLGTGGSPIDAATVAGSDFTVGGVAPSAAIVNTVASTDCVVGQCIYLTVAEQATDAKPKVIVTGSISDKAGNAKTSGTVAAAGDKLKPVLTVSIDPALDEKKVTIVVDASETLAASPAITAGGAPASGALTVFQSTEAIHTASTTSTLPSPVRSPQIPMGSRVTIVSVPSPGMGNGKG